VAVAVAAPVGEAGALGGHAGAVGPHLRPGRRGRRVAGPAQPSPAMASGRHVECNEGRGRGDGERKAEGLTTGERRRAHSNGDRVRERLPDNVRRNERFFLVSCPKEDPLEWVSNQCEPGPQDSHII
jgi:hypothetical protein